MLGEGVRHRDLPNTRAPAARQPRRGGGARGCWSTDPPRLTPSCVGCAIPPMRHGIALSFGVALALAASSAQACRCRPPPRPSVAAAQSEAVFVGTVLSARPSWSGARPSDAEVDDAHYVVTFRVAARWRGAAGATVTVRTAWARCGYGFEVGQTYLVYADADAARGPLWTSICARTRELSGAAYDFGDLGRPRSGALPRGAPRPVRRSEEFYRPVRRSEEF